LYNLAKSGFPAIPSENCAFSNNINSYNGNGEYIKDDKTTEIRTKSNIEAVSNDKNEKDDDDDGKQTDNTSTEVAGIQKPMQFHDQELTSSKIEYNYETIEPSKLY